MNCAGGAETKSILKWPDDDFERTFALNFNAVWYLSKAVAKPMIAQEKGAIVNISSGASLLAMPQAAPYGAAKAAVNNLTGSMAAAWAKKGIRVNSIAVGAVRAATLTDDAARYGLDPEAIAMSSRWAALASQTRLVTAYCFSPQMRPVSARGRRCTCTALLGQPAYETSAVSTGDGSRGRSKGMVK